MLRDNKKKVSFPNGSKLKIAIAASEFYEDIAAGLLKGALKVLKGSKVAEKNIRIVRVPGSFEIPFACQTILKEKKFDAIIALGCIVKGETDHDVYIAAPVSKAIMSLSLDHETPIGFGILTVNNLAQAKARSGGKVNRGEEAALAAVKMALLQDDPSPFF